MPSTRLIDWHRQHANDVDINSVQFTLRLLEEAERLRNGIEKSGG